VTFCPQQQRRYVLMAAIVASALGFIDGSVVSIAMPAMRESLGASLIEAQWISNSYMLMLSAFILVGGAAGDRFGLRRIFAGGIALFMLASIACALAPTAGLLIAARAVQGLGAAVMVPGSLAILSKAYPKEERARAIGIWASASAITTAAGPILGGSVLSLGQPELWRAIFAINLPLGALALYLLIAKVPADPHVPSKRIDFLGGIFAVLMLGFLAWALSHEGGSSTPVHIVVYLVLSALSFMAFIFVEQRAAEPIMPFRVFRSRSFSAANLATFFLYFALSAVLFYLPMTLVGGWGLPEGQAGFVFAPLTIAIALLSGPVGTLAARIGPGILIGAGSSLVGAAYAGLGFGLSWMSFWGHVMPMMMVAGLGMALVVAPLSAGIMGSVEDADTGSASGINNAVSRVAGLIAVAAMGSLAAWAYDGAQGPMSFGAAAASPVHAAASTAAFSAIAYASATMCFIAAIIAFAAISVPPQARGAPATRPGAAA
jgi:EmrB/QacA subfamily drug resistance transporter